MHAIIDTLDPKNHVTAERPAYPNKLTTRTRRFLGFAVFKQYLDFVPNRAEKYVRADD